MNRREKKPEARTEKIHRGIGEEKKRNKKHIIQAMEWWYWENSRQLK